MTATRTTPMPALITIVALSAFDRLSIAPMLQPIARNLGAPVALVTLAATANFLAYGLAQLAHGWLSDRLGRQRALKLALLVMGVANGVAAAAPDIGVLVIARAVVGAASGGLVPGALVVLADQRAGKARARGQAGLITALGFGTALAAVTGLADHGALWRIVFAATGIVALASIPLLWGGAINPASRSRPSLAAVLANTNVRFTSLLAVPEGAAVFGFVAFFPLALEHQGTSVPLAGAGTAAVGVGMMLGGYFVRRLTGSRPDGHLIGAGASILALGYATALVPVAAALILGASLTGLGQSAVHAPLQRWATEAAPEARGLSTAAFATGAFGGAGLATVLGSVLPDHYRTIFIAAAICAAGSGLIAARHHSPD